MPVMYETIGVTSHTGRPDHDHWRRLDAGDRLDERLVGRQRTPRSTAAPGADVASDRGARRLALVGERGDRIGDAVAAFPAIENRERARRRAIDLRAEPGEEMAGHGSGEPACLLADRQVVERAVGAHHARKRSL
jgi:hypothetical protein